MIRNRNKFGHAKRKMRPPPSSPPPPPPFPPHHLPRPPHHPLPPTLVIPYPLAITGVENTRFRVFEKNALTTQKKASIFLRNNYAASPVGTLCSDSGQRSKRLKINRPLEVCPVV